MKKLLSISLILFAYAVQGQSYISETAKINFFSKSAVEDITAQNTQAVSIFNAETGEIAYAVPIKHFKFAKSLMEEHFNEKYMDTEHYPKSTFSGKIINYGMQVAGVQTVRAQGKLTLHGVVKDIDVEGTFEVVKNQIKMNSKFKVKLEDYAIPRPQILWQNIAEEIEITIDFIYKPK